MGFYFQCANLLNKVKICKFILTTVYILLKIKLLQIDNSVPKRDFTLQEEAPLHKINHKTTSFAGQAAVAFGGFLQGLLGGELLVVAAAGDDGLRRAIHAP